MLNGLPLAGRVHVTTGRERVAHALSVQACMQQAYAQTATAKECF